MSRMEHGLPRKLRCPYCRHVFPSRDTSVCPACGRTMRVPPRFLLRPADLEKQRLARVARDRNHERQIQRRRSLRFVGSRRLWIIIAITAIAVFGVLLPLQYSRKAVVTTPPLPREARAVQDLWVLRTALECFLLDCHRYPSPAEGLKALIMPLDVEGWQGPYIDILKPDPWRTPYSYTLTNNQVRLLSAGPDQSEGTPDDLTAPPPDTTIPKLREAARSNIVARPPATEFEVRLAE